MNWFDKMSKKAASGSIMVNSFATLMGNHKKAIIYNRSGTAVRILTVKDGQLEIDPTGGHPIVTVGLSEPLFYEPWMEEPGSLVFKHPQFQPFAKICTEYDIIKYEDGSGGYIRPAEGIGRAPHEVNFNGVKMPLEHAEARLQSLLNGFFKGMERGQIELKKCATSRSLP